MKLSSIILLVLFLFLEKNDVFAQYNRTNLCDLDKSNMVPLRGIKNQPYQYTAQLKGSAIKNSDSNPLNIHFDTGSWSTSIPWTYLDSAHVTIIKPNTTDDWGKKADLVSGQLKLESEDSVYVIENYQFFAIIDEDWKIMGAFPSIQPGNSMPSLPYALAKKYVPNNLGFGIISDCNSDIDKNWGSLKSYLQFGITPDVSSQLNWRTDIPNWHNANTIPFCPEVTPGFKVNVSFPNSTNTITANGLSATIDTGAPDLTLKLGKNNPQNQPEDSSHFVRQGPWMGWNEGYKKHAKSLINADVTVTFTDSKGNPNSYTFPVSNDTYASPKTMYTGTWDSGVPWPYSIPSFEKERINLGNTIYFYASVFYFDIKNKRVGFGFNKTELITNEVLLTTQKLYSPNREFYLYMQEDGNLCIYRTRDNGFVWCSMAHGFSDAQLKLQSDGNLVVYSKGEARWSSKTQAYFNKKFKNPVNRPVKLVLGNDGILRLFTEKGKVVWSAN